MMYTRKYDNFNSWPGPSVIAGKQTDLQTRWIDKEALTTTNNC